MMMTTTQRRSASVAKRKKRSEKRSDASTAATAAKTLTKKSTTSDTLADVNSTPTARNRATANLSMIVNKHRPSATLVVVTNRATVNWSTGGNRRCQAMAAADPSMDVTNLLDTREIILNTVARSQLAIVEADLRNMDSSSRDMDSSNRDTDSSSRDTNSSRRNMDSSNRATAERDEVEAIMATMKEVVVATMMRMKLMSMASVDLLLSRVEDMAVEVDGRCSHSENLSMTARLLAR